MPGAVYKITNKINNKSYIGITQQDVKQRFRQHKYYGNNKLRHSHLYNAMSKYGVDNFDIEVLEDVNDIMELENKEIEYVKEYKPEYNMTEGGRYRYHLSEESKKKISDALKGKKKSSEHIEKYKKSMKRYWEDGVTYKKDNVPQETRDKISTSLKEYWKNAELSDETRKKLSDAANKRWNKERVGQ